MNLTEIAGAYAQAQALGGFRTQQARGNTADAVSDAFKRANDRVEQEQESTKVRLSAFGQIQSSFSQVRTAGKALSEVRETATADDMKKSVQGFVTAYNNAVKSVGTAVGSREKAGVLAEESRARLAGNDLRRTTMADDNLAELRKMGVTANKDGTLAFDAKAFDKAAQGNIEGVRTSMSGVGQRMEQVAARELSGTGNVGSTVKALDARAKSLESLRAGQETMVAETQRVVEKQGQRLDAALNGSLVASYEKIFSL